MAVISYLCALLAGWYLWRWARSSRDRNPLDMRFPAVPLAVVAAIGVACYVPTWRVDRAAVRAGDAASRLLGERVEYRCGSVLGMFFDRDTDMHAGYVRATADGTPEKWSKLRWEACDGLLVFLKAPDDLATQRQVKVLSLHLLSHEAMHMAGEMRENVAECQALQRNATLARELGASPAAAKELAIIYWQEFYPRITQGYFSPDCRPGGALDERLPDSPWRLAR